MQGIGLGYDRLRITGALEGASISRVKCTSPANECPSSIGTRQSQRQDHLASDRDQKRPYEKSALPTEYIGVPFPDIKVS